MEREIPPSSLVVSQLSFKSRPNLTLHISENLTLNERIVKLFSEMAVS